MVTVVVRTRTVNTTTRYVGLVQAVASRGGSHSQNCSVVAVYTDRKCGLKATIFLLLVAKDKENPVVGAKKMLVARRVAQVVAYS